MLIIETKNFLDVDVQTIINFSTENDLQNLGDPSDETKMKVSNYIYTLKKSKASHIIISCSRENQLMGFLIIRTSGTEFEIQYYSIKLPLETHPYFDNLLQACILSAKNCEKKLIGVWSRVPTGKEAVYTYFFKHFEQNGFTEKHKSFYMQKKIVNTNLNKISTSLPYELVSLNQVNLDYLFFVYKQVFETLECCSFNLESPQEQREEFDTTINPNYCELNLSATKILLVEHKIAGFIFVHNLDSQTGYIADFGIHQSYRRKGFGKLLILHAEKALVDQKLSFLTLYVDCKNNSAQSLYRSLNFQTQRHEVRYELQLPK